MAPLFRKHGRRRRRNDHDGLSIALTDAGVRLLARKDYEAISMRQIAREAGCSVATVYSRYSDKSTYLYRIIAHGFRNMTDRATLSLAREGWARASANSIVQKIVSHVVQEMISPRAAGIIRAAMKLSTVNPSAQEPFEKYRTKVAELSADLLADKTQQPRSAVRIGMQIVFATLTDAVLQKRPGPMNAGSKRMTSVLTSVLLGYLGSAGDEMWAGDESNSEDDPSDIRDLGSETPPELEDGEIAVFDPDMGTYVGKRLGLRQKQRKRRKGVTANSADTVVGNTEKKPTTVKLSKPAAAKSAASPKSQQPSKPARRRHRVI